MSIAPSWAWARSTAVVAGALFAGVTLAGACLDYAGEGFEKTCDDGSGTATPDVGSGSGNGAGATEDAGTGSGKRFTGCDAGAALPPDTGSGSGNGAAPPP